MPKLVRTLDQVLHSKVRGPRFFRQGLGPTKTDLKYGLPLQRPRLQKKIAIRLLEDGHHLLIGAPASGKTVLAFQLGYYLQNETGDFSVYVLDGGDISYDKIASCKVEIDEILKYQNKKRPPLFIFENFHRSFEPANEVAHHLVEAKCPILFVTRPSFRFYRDIKYPNILLSFEERDAEQYCTTVTYSELCDELILAYAESRGKEKRLVPRDVESLKVLARGDLWRLAFLLEEYCKPRKHLTIESVWASRVAEANLLRDQHGPSSISAIAEIALLSELEIRMPLHIASSFYGEDVLAALSQSHLIETRDHEVAFFHSSIATVYVSALIDAGIEIQDRGKDLVRVIERVIASDGRVARTILKRLCLRSDLMEILLKRQVVRDTIGKLFSGDDATLSACADLITDCCRMGTREIADQVTDILQINIATIQQKVEEDSDVEEISFFLGSIPWILADGISEVSLVQLPKDAKGIQSEEGVSHPCHYAVPNDPNSGMVKLFTSIAKCSSTIQSVYRNVQPCTRIRGNGSAFFCGKSLLCRSSRLNKLIVQEMDSAQLVEKLEQWSDPYEVMTLLHTMLWVDPTSQRTRLSSIASKLVGLRGAIADIQDESRRVYSESVLNELERLEP